jgi:hypothetical protein
MEQGKYSILLGRFDGFSVASAQPGAGDGSAQISLVDVKASSSHARAPRTPPARPGPARARGSPLRRRWTPRRPPPAGAPRPRDGAAAPAPRPRPPAPRRGGAHASPGRGARGR